MVMKLKGGYYTNEPTPQEEAEGRKRDEQERRDRDAFLVMLREDAPSVVNGQTPRDLLVSMMSPIERDPYWASGCLHDLSDELRALGALCGADTEITPRGIADRLSALSLRVLTYSQIAELLEQTDQDQAKAGDDGKEAAQ
jgi:hypothetical protein